MPRRFRRNFSYDDPTDGTPDVDSASVDLTAAEDGAEAYCGRCAYFTPGELGGEGVCTIVEGPILAEQVCTLFVRRGAPTDAEELPEPPALPEAEGEAPPAEEGTTASAQRVILAGGYMIGEGLPTDLMPGETLAEAHSPVAMTRIAVLMREGEVSADGRYIDEGALTWREPPLTLTINHDPDQRPAIITDFGRVADLAALEALAEGAVAEAREITRDEFQAAVGDTGPYIVGRVEFDELWVGEDTAREVQVGLLRGVSVEIGDEEAEYVETVDGGAVYIVHAGRIGAASLTPFGAIESARVLVPDEAITDESIEAELELPAPIVADAATLLAPPRAWFEDPGFDGPTPITVDDDGHVYGHIATWGTCHVGRPGECLEPPRSSTGYAYFAKPDAVVCDDGSKVAAGSITLGTGHAPATRGVSARAAADHYDNTGTVTADVAIGEDDHGIWCAGRVAPEADELQVQRFRASKVSGDWRPVPEGLELVAVLAVNSPGFPVMPRAVVASGERIALFSGLAPVTAAGDEPCGCGQGDLAAEVRRLSAIIDAAGLREQAVDAIAASIAR